MKKRPRSKAVKAPERWSESTLKLREHILKQYQFDSIGAEILANLLDSHERMDQARAILAVEGLTVHDRFGQVRAHPCFEMESVSRAAVLKHARSLGLDMADIQENEAIQ